MITAKEFRDGWLHFCDCLDFEHSALDAKAIGFMSWMPTDVVKALAAWEASTPPKPTEPKKE